MTEADVDAHAHWREAWGLRIPVLLAPDGAAVCVSAFDGAAIAARLRAG